VGVAGASGLAHFPASPFRRSAARSPRTVKRLFLLLLTLALVACGRSPVGQYSSFGSEDKFRMVLELGNGGIAKFTTRSNLGNPQLDRSVEDSMSLTDARWMKDGEVVVVSGKAKDGKPLSYRFAVQQNGDLVWEKTGARLVKSR
jgi:hypothetical protein